MGQAVLSRSGREHSIQQSDQRSPLTDLTAGDPLVVAESIRKDYGSFNALSDVSFEVERGVTGLLGANGSGKTTTLGLILGLHRPTEGNIQVFGRDPSIDGQHLRTHIGYSPEHQTLPQDVRAADFVAEVAQLHGIPAGDAIERSSDALWLVGLGEERFRPLGTMSTGQKQRVKLAQAIVHDPKLVLLDEPTDGLDPYQRDQVLSLIESIAADFGISVMLSSHLMTEVQRVCQAVVIIGEGRTLAAGSMAEVRGASTEIVLELESGEDAQLVSARLGTRNHTHTTDGRSILVAGDDDRTLIAVRDACAEAGVGVRRLGSRKRSLEEIFLGHVT